MFKGSIVALVTPMNADGIVDRNQLQKLIDYHVKSGTSAIVSVGTTGESATLNHVEHLDMVKLTVELADGRIPIIAGTGANSTSEAISLTKGMASTGVVGCLSVTPYYNKPMQEGLYQHYKIIAENTDLPQILYNVPGRTGCDLLPTTVARLAEIPNIVALKEATGNLSRVTEIRSMVGDEFILLSGDDATMLEFIQLGGKGTISVTANIAAAKMAEICRLALAGDFEQAHALNQKIMPLHKKLFVESNPIPVKWACKRLGLISDDTMRLPMTPLASTSVLVVEQALLDAGLL